jgi:RNA polymerase sigma-70 factor, ECF subfamily
VQDSRVSRASSIERIYREQSPKLWRSLVAYSGNDEVASDALAEAFAQALRRGEELTDPAAWIWRTAFRIANGELKRMRSVSQPGPVAVPTSHTDVLELVEALRTLSPNQRLALILHDYADRPVDEVCAILRIRRSTAYVHLSTGRRRLRALLQEEPDE